MSKKKIILGLNAFHADTSAAILVDNELIAAAEESDLIEKNIGVVFHRINKILFTKIKYRVSRYH